MPSTSLTHTELAAIIRYAHDKHTGQKYGNRAYTAHLQEVAEQALKLRAHVSDFDELTVRATAWLHDVLEDTTATYAELAELAGTEIADAVQVLTKQVGQQGYSYEAYVAGVLANPLALLVKRADTLCNLAESVRGGDAMRVAKYAKQVQKLTIV